MEFLKARAAMEHTRFVTSNYAEATKILSVRGFRFPASFLRSKLPMAKGGSLTDGFSSDGASLALYLVAAQHEDSLVGDLRSVLSIADYSRQAAETLVKIETNDALLALVETASPSVALDALQKNGSRDTAKKLRDLAKTAHDPEVVDGLMTGAQTIESNLQPKSR